jgi:hypothetical protein
MANNLTQVQDIRIADKFLEAFVAALTPLRAFSTDFSPEFSERGKTVNVPVIGAANTSYDFAGSYSANADSDVQGIPVVLDGHKVQSLHLTDKEVSESSWVSIERLAISKARQLAQDVLTDIWSIVTAANYGAPAIDPVDAEDFDSSTVLAVRKACAQANMPVTDRALILDSAYYSNLLGDPKISHSYLMQMSQPALMEARIPRVYGFDVYETTILPDNSQNLVGFASHPRGLAVAMRYLKPIVTEAYIEAGPVTDPQSGITLGYRRYYDTDSGKLVAAFECVYGFKKAIAAGIKRITAPAAGG